MFLLIPIALTVGLGLILFPSSPDQSGPNGGEIVPLEDGQTSGEVLANVDTGEVRVYTWSQDLKSIQPVKDMPLKLGSGDQTLELEPQPDASDAPGYCSTFFGHADWLCGGNVLHGWISTASDGTTRRNFEWKHGWQADRFLKPICCGANCHGP